VTYTNIVRVMRFVRNNSTIATAPPTLVDEQWYVRLIDATNVPTDIPLGNLASQPTWTNDAAGYVLAESAIYAAFPSGGGGGSVAWGAISGTLSDQADLQGALDAKADAANVPTVLDVMVIGTTMTGVNQFGDTFTLTETSTGVFRLTADSSAPFTSNKTYVGICLMNNLSPLHFSWSYNGADRLDLLFIDTPGTPTNPERFSLYVRVYA
jgi:hypothetical protein